MQDMREVEFVPFRLTEVAEIFSIRIVGNEHSELQDFLIAFKSIESPDLHKDFEQILKTLAGIAQEGAKQSFFRQEGKMKDRVCAIPLLTSHRQKHKGTLRLYCIRICDKLLIVGGGGIKTTRTYEEDEKLYESVKTLQMIDKELANLENDGKILLKEIYNIKIYID